MNIFVGSTNPVKLNATKQAAINTWPEVVIKGFEVESGISQQPFTDEETRLGSDNRARKALEIGLKELDSHFRGNDEVLGVGLEGGVFEHQSGKLWNTVWVSIADNSGKIVSANGERFELPDSLTAFIRKGKEMGPAMDELIGSTNIKQKEGMIGVITQKFIDRTEMYAGLTKLALGLWYGRNWEKELQNR